MIITATGTHFFTEETFQPGRLALMGFSGTFGGTTVTLGYRVGASTFVPYVKEDGTNVTLTSPGGFQVRVMRSGVVGVQLTGGSAISVDIDVLPAVDMPNRL